jgi:hypothetical protein
VILDYLIPS